MAAIYVERHRQFHRDSMSVKKKKAKNSDGRWISPLLNPGLPHLVTDFVWRMGEVQGEDC